jgi:hypothetical protein
MCGLYKKKSHLYKNLFILKVIGESIDGVFCCRVCAKWIRDYFSSLFWATCWFSPLQFKLLSTEFGPFETKSPIYINNKDC